MSDIIRKLFILLETELSPQLYDEEKLAVLMKQRSRLREIREARPMDGALACALEEAADLLDGEEEEARTLALFRTALVLGMELGRMTF